MRVGNHYQTPNTTYGANGRSRAGGRSRASGGDAEAAASATEDEPKKAGATSEDTVELSGIAEDREQAVATATAEQVRANEESAETAEEAVPAADESEEAEETETDETGAAGSGAAEEAEETDEDEEAKLIEEAKKAAEKAAEEAKKAEEEAAAAARKEALATLKSDFKSYLNKLVFSPGLSKAPINISISDEAFEKMLDDPAYKKEMEHKIMREFMNMDWLTTSPAYMHINIDSSGKYSATPYMSNVSTNYTTETKNAFWTKGTGTTGSGSSTPTAEDELLAYQKEMFDMLRGESTAERRMFKTQLMNQYRVSMLSYLNQGYAADSLSTFSSLI